MNAGRNPSATEQPLITALQGQRVDPPPIWLMRQAGRYMADYRALRSKAGSFLELCYTPEWATEITLQPIRRFGFDAAILFSDILVVPDALGQPVRFEEGVGPRLDPLPADMAGSLRAAGSAAVTDHFQPVYEAVASVRAALPAACSLIGFAGAPWTVATYMIEGGTSRAFEAVRLRALCDPDGFAALIDRLVEVTAAHLVAQIDAGADAVQLFDSHAGALDESGFARWIVAPTRRIVDRIRAAHSTVPVIGFPRGAGVRLEHYVAETGVTAVGLDQAVSPDWAAGHIQPRVAVQGNLDPIHLRGDRDALRVEVENVLRAFSAGPHIFNLGHGVMKETSEDMVEFLVRTVRDFS